jgi:hypothetical protein
MKGVKFRIIELENCQVMLEKEQDWEDEESPYKLAIVFHTEELRAKPSLGYSEEEKRDKYFDEMTDVQAQKVVDGILNMLSSDEDEDDE